ncbi:protein-methionine-sulfoxide reductase catalytic subunit MsrP [Marinimicrobium alkaliphilum]|uniref:protein-methionine-sulfoxide reductase catalytic subunit MsrP n=1 Tax=Marinimicrobium alkaliphilum TaxID=2202654 RepID=UPI000DB99776|nr:protein-methionine-sulfoxide reductase catalytic subunit MsrP [Marinimicrobium alkaliphilum]
MLIKTRTDIPASEITPEPVYRARRDFMRGAMSAAALGLGAIAAPPLFAAPAHVARGEGRGPDWLRAQIAAADENTRALGETLTPFEHVTSYNNFYEFGQGKTDPADKADALTTDPWSVEIAGEVAKPGVYPLEDVLKGMDLEERVYRLRCVEAWSMVIPWIGFPLAALLQRVEPTSKAKYVAFETLVRPAEMPAQRSRFSTIDWPYREGLRLDEAMHPLTLMAVGLYGKTLPNQNGAPLRLVVPWKYGFKSIKSIVKIVLTEREPKTTWNMMQPREYGFYANVNPEVDHPRWSQASERRLPSGLFRPNIIPTRLFNGYAEEVAHLYKGMDLTRYY